MTFSLDSVYSIYNQFLNYFPAQVHGLVSFALACLLVFGIYKILRKELIYIVLLVVLLPASAPILKSTWAQILQLLQFLLSRR